MHVYIVFVHLSHQSFSRNSEGEQPEIPKLKNIDMAMPACQRASNVNSANRHCKKESL
jgi:hypothetical protein